MRSLSRVVWREGMHLAQHHFQLQSRWVEESAAFALDQLFFRPYGVVACELDADALLNGTASLIHARGVMPDGIAFQFPDDAAPAPLRVDEAFAPTDESRRLLLTIAPYRPGEPNCALEPRSADGLRYTAVTQTLRDDTLGADEKPVALARKNFRLELDPPGEGRIALPLATIRRDHAGHFVYDPEYVPPVVQVSASRRLLEMLRRLIDILSAKADYLAAQRRASVGTEEYGAREIAGYWMAHAVHTGLAALRCDYETRNLHPERLFRDMSRLAGALCTFSLQADAGALPVYDHDDLGGCFGALDAQIRAHLDVALPEGALRVTLDPAEPLYYRGVVADRRALLPPSRWYLGFRSSARQADVLDGVPKLVKLCSAAHISKLVERAFPGLELEHEPTPPSAILPRAGFQYFAVRRSGGCWTLLENADPIEVGAYVPGALPDAELELLVLIQEGA